MAPQAQAEHFKDKVIFKKKIFFQVFYLKLFKNTTKVFDLIEAMKRLSSVLWPDDAANFNSLFKNLYNSFDQQRG